MQSMIVCVGVLYDAHRGSVTMSYRMAGNFRKEKIFTNLPPDLVGESFVP